MNIASPSAPYKTKLVKDWTLLYLLDGSADLRETATLDLVELSQNGAPDNTYVVAQLFRGNSSDNLGPAVVRPDWRGVRTFEVGSQSLGTLTREADTKNPETPRSPKTLEDYLTWGMREYPAKKYAVILAGHGNSQSIFNDTEGESLPISMAARAIRNAGQRVGQAVDLVVLDACSTANPENAALFSQATEYLVASPDKIGGVAFQNRKH